MSEQLTPREEFAAQAAALLAAAERAERTIAEMAAEPQPARSCPNCKTGVLDATGFCSHCGWSEQPEEEPTEEEGELTIADLASKRPPGWLDEVIEREHQESIRQGLVAPKG